MHYFIELQWIDFHPYATAWRLLWFRSQVVGLFVNQFNRYGFYLTMDRSVYEVMIQLSNYCFMTSSVSFIFLTFHLDSDKASIFNRMEKWSSDSAVLIILVWACISFFNLIAQPSKGMMIYTAIRFAMGINNRLDQGNVLGCSLHLFSLVVEL